MVRLLLGQALDRVNRLSVNGPSELIEGAQPRQVAAMCRDVTEGRKTKGQEVSLALCLQILDQGRHREVRDPRRGQVGQEADRVQAVAEDLTTAIATVVGLSAHKANKAFILVGEKPTHPIRLRLCLAVCSCLGQRRWPSPNQNLGSGSLVANPCAVELLQLLHVRALGATFQALGRGRAQVPPAVLRQRVVGEADADLPTQHGCMQAALLQDDLPVLADTRKDRPGLRGVALCEEGAQGRQTRLGSAHRVHQDESQANTPDDVLDVGHVANRCRVIVARAGARCRSQEVADALLRSADAVRLRAGAKGHARVAVQAPQVLHGHVRGSR
mmetsp:Transcript_7670/g.21501  ORF Transcript_7670/g.21501 Transcript_7670/m.21501 type:complete len:329 (-) Transcript_7670:665-1651(-)